MGSKNANYAYEQLRSYVFDSPDRSAAIPHGMFGGSGMGSHRHYSGREAIGTTDGSYVALCMDERRGGLRHFAARTALLHIAAPSGFINARGLTEAEFFEIDTLALNSRTPHGLTARHRVHVPHAGFTRSNEIRSYLSSISGDPSCPDALRSGMELTDLDWRDAMATDYARFAVAITRMASEFED